MHSAIGKACYESASLLLISDLKEMLKKAKAFSSPAVSPLWQALHCATLASSPVTLPTRLTLSLSTPRFYLRRHQYIPSQCNGWSRRAYLERAGDSTPSPPPSDLVLLPLISPYRLGRRAMYWSLGAIPSQGEGSPVEPKQCKFLVNSASSPETVRREMCGSRRLKAVSSTQPLIDHFHRCSPASPP